MASQNGSGNSPLYFLRINKFVDLPEMPGIARSSRLVGSFLGNPSLKPCRADINSLRYGKDDVIGEEAISVELPQEKVDRVTDRFKKAFGKSKYRHNKDEGVVDNDILTKLEYGYLGVRSGLDSVDALRDYLRSRRYLDGIEAIWNDSLKMMKKGTDRNVKLSDEQDYRFFTKNKVIDLSLSREGKYPRITLDVFGRVSSIYDRLSAYLMVQKAFERLLAGNPYKEAIRVAFSREGFGYDLNFEKINPKQFRTTDKLPKKVIF